MIAALIFDFDGVIADTERLHLAAMQAALRSAHAEGINLTTENYYANYLGFDDEGVFRVLSADHGVDLGDERIRELVETKGRIYDQLLRNQTSEPPNLRTPEPPNHSILYPGAAACIRRFHGRVPLAIASGAYASEIRAVLRPAGLLSCFETIVGCGDTATGKPAADPYVEAAHRLNADPHRCVAIEDSRWGIQSAVAAGMTCIAVTTNYGAHELPGAVLVVPSLDAVTLELIEELG